MSIIVMHDSRRCLSATPTCPAFVGFPYLIPPHPDTMLGHSEPVNNTHGAMHY